MSVNPPEGTLTIENSHLDVKGNVSAVALKLGTLRLTPSYGLDAVANVSNSTTHTLELSNATTGLVTTSNVVVGKDLAVSGNATVSSNLTVGGGATVSSNLTVSGNATVSSNLTVSGNATVSSNLTVTGDATMSSNLEVGTANLFVNTTTGRVGIGTDGPQNKLAVAGNVTLGAGAVTTNSAYHAGILNVIGGSTRALLRIENNSSVGSPGIIFGEGGGFTEDTVPTIKKVQGTNNLAIMTGGNVGVGTSSPVERLQVAGNITLGSSTQRLFRPAYYYNQTYAGTIGSASHYLEINNTWTLVVNGFEKMFIRPDAGVILDNFTGQHRSFVDNVWTENIKDYVGLIVCANKNAYTSASFNTYKGNRAIQINESLPDVRLSNVAYDKSCFGVISSGEDPESREDTYGSITIPVPKEKGDTRTFINSVGEGAIWVTNINGPLESGDYITTSNVVGYGQRQDDDILHNYTVAKITMDCDFNPQIQPVKQIKKEPGNVDYWLQYRTEIISEEEYNVLPDTQRRIGSDDIYYRLIYEREDTKDPLVYETDNHVWIHESREELVNSIDEKGIFIWEDHPTETEKAYKIRHLDADGNITDEANAVHTAAFVGCTYHCG
jgi:hypothetical protein